ncbi:hypothetical protein [Enterobacter bugandensis]|uniref:hypothetical protein n=1 Tax=Enterobacter bugandensis TaxID=881260 RepID=UPI0021D116D9|nr:hypothetical protein [Enterobacter bugandensis]MCU6172416.1 hypothetical protein [Enterobacter bugandensis]
MPKLIKLIIIILSCSMLSAQSATLEITANFTPDVNNPSNNKFINTTPISGFCGRWLNYCNRNGIDFSINIPITTVKIKDIKANHEPRDGAYFKLPGVTSVTVKNEKGEHHILEFKFKAFAATIYRNRNSNDFRDQAFAWGGRTLSDQRCGNTALASSPGWQWYAFGWKWDGGTACYKRSNIDRLLGTDDHDSFEDQSIAYELIAPNPLTMGDGVYTGSVTYTVGPGGDFDYGDAYSASDSVLTVNFTLKVTHELKVRQDSGSDNVTLTPCYQGEECIKNDAEKNWERWMVTNIPPQQMLGTSNFKISSSGSFTVYMKCGTGAALSSDTCPMVSEKSGTIVPVKAALTLPNNIADQSGNSVVNAPLYTEKSGSRNQFTTHLFGIEQPGKIDFTIGKKDIIEMLKSRPDSWSGTVTIIFDPNIY